jgi:predicted ATP-grasp superfamily ATP-dependent carboligase
MSRDIVAAVQMMRKGLLSPKAYFASILKVRSWAAFAPADPLPAIADAPLVIYRILTRRIFVRR